MGYKIAYTINNLHMLLAAALHFHHKYLQLITYINTVGRLSIRYILIAYKYVIVLIAYICDDPEIILIIYTIPLSQKSKIPENI
jgi:hypothetical protein